MAARGAQNKVRLYMMCAATIDEIVDGGARAEQFVGTLLIELRSVDAMVHGLVRDAWEAHHPHEVVETLEDYMGGLL